eukprot:CAMPEP_0203814268 /NCGR_PEP_ID=MMETSP0115-20131106/5183_1 /ASSEMBLY_ACC=CAM_ASM_000227 /TAXON_ID=33651 /ORGANISM="Bicosoecid sp, Strain ms1" /LENGTH=512 /DNA_ID=CAMNT_0050723143 /DNA_START=61 /DNA_END=1597 /DNA_ORIENTATION=+
MALRGVVVALSRFEMAAIAPTRRAAAVVASRGVSTTPLAASAIAGAPPAARQDKEGGTIADLFVNLGKEVDPMEPRFAELKELLRSQYGLTPSVRDDAWRRLEAAMARTSSRLAALDSPSDIVPIVEFDDVAAAGGFTEEQADAIREVGSVVVRGVVPAEQALAWKADVRRYYAAHPGIRGFPEDHPQVYELYWTPAQVQARQHAGVYLTTTLLNKLWLRGGAAAADDRAFSAHGFAYCDRLRIRDPGDAKFALGPHVDGGGIERWEDEEYRACYASILSGDWEAHDAFAPEHRVRAAMDLYSTPNACTAFRTFQGWMALSDTAPGEGTLRVHPDVKTSTAYILLRPFLDDIAGTDFPGAVPGTAQDVNSVFHAPICEQMVSVPAVRPGDMVFWHGDVVHAVEAQHRGQADSSVFYIPAVPSCGVNGRYMARQRAQFVAGRTPPDFPQNNSEVGFDDRGAEADLTPLGRRMMGLDSWASADASDELVAVGGPTTGAALRECDAESDFEAAGA